MNEIEKISHSRPLTIILFCCLAPSLILLNRGITAADQSKQVISDQEPVKSVGAETITPQLKAQAKQQVHRSPHIKYINPPVPDIELPSYAWQTCDVMVPDTLDLQQMARLAINGLTGPTDPKADYEIYFWANFKSNPPRLRHDRGDECRVKHMESLPLLRLISGSTQNLHVEQRWMEIIPQMQGPDGLLYMSKIGRPWAFAGLDYGNEPPGDFYMTPWSQGRLLNAITIYYLLTGDQQWQQLGSRVVDGMTKAVTREGNKAHFHWWQYGTQGRYIECDRSLAVHNLATYHAWTIQGLANFYRHTRYEPAIKLASEMFRWVKEDSNHFADDGTFLEEYPGTGMVHFHGHTMVLLGVLDYGIAAGDKDAIDFAHRGFRYAATQGDRLVDSDSTESLIGFFPEFLNLWNTLESCELADMIALALKLSQSGTGDYWDHADRWIRNLFVESQLTNSNWVYWNACNYPPMEVPPDSPFQTPLPDHPVERNIGAFGGWLMPNEFIPDEAWEVAGIMHCCVGNASRAVYYIWENILTYQNGKLKVNLLLNRASPWADVDSHIPYTGQVDIRVKKSLDLSVRIPEWVKPEETDCQVNGKTRKLTFDGRFALIGSVDNYDLATITFPIREQIKKIHFNYKNQNERVYKLLMRGNTCVAIDPPGIHGPLFQRGYYRRDVTRWHEVKRYLPDKRITW